MAYTTGQLLQGLDAIAKGYGKTLPPDLVSDPILAAKYSSTDAVPASLAVDPTPAPAPMSAAPFSPVGPKAPEPTYTPGMAAPYSSVAGPDPAPVSNALPPPPAADASPAEKQAYYLRMKDVYGASPAEAQAALTSSAPVTPAAAGGVPVSLPQPAPVASAPAPAPAPKPAPPPAGMPSSLGPPKPTTFADKKAAVLLPGEEEAFQHAQEANALDRVWTDARADVRAEGAAKAALEYDKALGEQTELLAQQKAKDEAFTAWAAKDFAKRQALADEIASSKVDPSRFWKDDAGMGRAMIAAVAGVFGVLGAPATGGKNAAVEQIDKAIERDMQAQQSAIESKKAGLAAQQSEYGLRVKMFQDERLARASYMADSYRLAAKRVEAIAMKTSNQDQILAASQLSDQLEAKAAAADDQFKLGVEKNYAALQAANAKAAAVASASMAAKADKYRDKIMDAEIEGAKTVLKEYPGAQLVVEGNHVVIVDPTTGKRIWAGSGGGGGKPGETTTVNIPVAQEGGGLAFAPTVVNKNGSTEVAKQAGGYAKAIQAIERMDAAASMPGPWTGKKRITYEAALSDYISNYAVAKGMGAVSKDEGERIAKTTVPTPTWGGGYMTDAEYEQLGAQKKALSAEAAGLGTAYGTPGTAGPAPISSLGAPVKK